MTDRLPNPTRYVPYGEVGDQENIVVDGAPLASTVLTLSHWPNNQTPEALKRDTSTDTVFAYLDRPDMHQGVDIVSNNHFDEDGLFSMFALCYPDIAIDHRELLVEGAMAGDFGVYSDRDATRLCFVIEAFTDRQISPFDESVFAQCERQRIVSFYTEMLARLPDILQDLEEYRGYWREQDEFLRESESLLARGDVEIEQMPDFDLAIVRIPELLPRKRLRRYLESENAPVHPFAIHNATSCNRILRIQNGCFEFQYRYESWVQVASHRPLLRVDLSGFADRLNTMEEAAGIWRADKVLEVSPRLFLEGVDKSSIEEKRFLDELVNYLSSQPTAWDPYDWDGTTVS